MGPLLCEGCAQSYGYHRGREVLVGHGDCYECQKNIEEKRAFSYSEKEEK